MSKNKIFLAIIAVIVVLAIPLTLLQVQQQQNLKQRAGGGAVELKLSPSSDSKSKNNIFRVSVILESAGNDISSVAFTLSSTNPQAVTILGFQPSPDYDPIVNTDNDDSNLQFVGVNKTTEQKTGSINLGTLELQSNTKEGISFINFSSITVTASGVGAVSATSQDGNYSVVEQSASTPSTSAPTAIPTTSSIKCGPGNTVTVNNCDSVNNQCGELTDPNTGNITYYCAPKSSLSTSSPTTTPVMTQDNNAACRQKCINDQSELDLTCYNQCVKSIPTPTAMTAPIPTNTPPAPTAVPAPNDTLIALSLNLGEVSGANINPQTKTKIATVELFNASNQLVISKTGNIIFNPSNNLFTGTVNLGSSITTGSYIIKTKTDKYLKRLIPGIHTITAGQTTILPQGNLVVGDIDENNKVDILDFNIIVSCFGNKTCSNKASADLNDDGFVNGVDYNALVRALSVKEGD